MTLVPRRTLARGNYPSQRQLIQNQHFYPAIFLPTGVGFVVGDRQRFAVALEVQRKNAAGEPKEYTTFLMVAHKPTQ